MDDTTVEIWAAKPWRTAPLVAIDLEGTGGQDRENEAILEIAAVRLIDGLADMATAYTTLVNPGRSIPRRHWISPDLTDQTLAGAPPLDAVEPDLAARLNGRILVGHNIGVDWRLLHRRCPTITPAALLDTHKLTKAAAVPGPHSLTALLSTLCLTDTVTAAAPDSRPHRALWDTAGTAALLAQLINRLWRTDPTLDTLLTAAHRPLAPQPAAARPSDTDTLF